MLEKRLKRAVESIQLSEEKKSSLVKRCCQAEENNVEEMKMKSFNMRKITVLAVAAVLCLGLSVGAAAGGFGWFKDILALNGAVVGTEYMNASEEMKLNAKVENNTLKVSIEMVKKVPYSVVEFLSLDMYQIVDENGFVIFHGEEVAAAAVKDCCTELLLPIETLKSGSYKLKVESFVADSKADAPMKISGSWECEFVK